MRVLLIEDDVDVRTTLKAGLETECFAVDTAEDGERGSFLARTGDYDVVLLDRVLPKKDGQIVCKEIRASVKKPYIMMLSVMDKPSQKTELLNAGADDYIAKPYSFEELLARIRAVMRRPRETLPTIFSYNDIHLDPHSQTVMKGDNEIKLTKKEFMLLEYLLRNRGRVVSRGMLGEHVWDSGLNLFSNTIESHILSLRKKLDGNRRPGMIQTVQGRGYRLGSPHPVVN